MKLLGTVTSSALEESTLCDVRFFFEVHALMSSISLAKNPQTWVNPIKAQVKHDFQATNQQELSLRSGQAIYIAPREIQNTQKLLNTGWVLATLNNQTSGIIPLNYVQSPQQVPIKANTNTMASVEQMQPKNIPDVGQTNVYENIPLADNGFPSMNSVLERTPDEIMHQVFAEDV